MRQKERKKERWGQKEEKRVRERSQGAMVREGGREGGSNLICLLGSAGLCQCCSAMCLHERLVMARTEAEPAAAKDKKKEKKRDKKRKKKKTRRASETPEDYAAAYRAWQVGAWV